MQILVTGAAGYIGSHTCVELLEAGYDIVAVDNLVNSHRAAMDRIQQITGKSFPFYEADMCDRGAMDAVFAAHSIGAVLHFAGLKAVGESVEKPLDYYDNNLTGTLNLVRVMESHGCRKIIFSSSATVYGEAEQMPITEDCPKGMCTNPYGWTKWMQEQILSDLHTADDRWCVMLLRYFNPIGAHKSGLIGEDPAGIPNNLLPYIAQVATGKLPFLRVFGDDYDTPDGTGVRDYIHVVDLARGHISALKKLEQASGVFIYNLGTGRGYSVLEVVAAFERACGHAVPYRIAPRRPGDIGTCYCDPGKAERELGWKALYDMDEMCRDAYRWQCMNPHGFRTGTGHE